MPTLRSINATLLTGPDNNDGLDNNSTLTIVLHPNEDGIRAAEHTFYGSNWTNPQQTFSFDLRLNTASLTRNQINNNYSIDVIITAVGHDHYKGLLNCRLNFSDGSFEGFTFDFEIGTHKEPNQKGKIVHFING